MIAGIFTETIWLRSKFCKQYCIVLDIVTYKVKKEAKVKKEKFKKESVTFTLIFWYNSREL